MKEPITLESQTYSLAQLWNLNAQSLNDSVADGLVEPVPVSGDAHKRQQYAHAVATACAESVRRSTHTFSASDHRARISAHGANVLDGGDPSTLKPTC